MKKAMTNIFLVLSVTMAHTAAAYNCYPPDGGILSNGQTVCAAVQSASTTVYQCNGSTGQMVNTGQKCTCTGSLMSSSSGKMCSGSYTTSSSTSTSTFASLYRAK
jgi:hypothetical protein